MSADRPIALVVDPERFYREAIRDSLTSAGIESVLASDGRSALEGARDERVGVVVLEVHLPDVGGIELLQRLLKRRPELRVVLLSAHADQELVLDGLRFGASDYLAKPLHDEELVLVVRRELDDFAVGAELRRIRERLGRLAEGLGGISEGAGDLDSTSREARLCQQAVRATAELLQATKTSILLLDPEASRLRVVAAVGRDLAPEEMDAVPLGEGVAGAALARAEALSVREASEDERFCGRVPNGRYASESFAVAPLGPGVGACGVLCATDLANGRAFGPEELALLRVLALQIGALLTSSAAAEPPPAPDPAHAAEPGGSEGEVELARAICEAVISEVEPERVIESALRPIAAALPAAPVALFLADNGSGELVRQGECDGGRRSDRPRLPAGRGLTGAVLQTGLLVATDHPEADPRFDAEVDTPDGGEVGPMLCVPLRFRGRSLGVCRIFPVDGASASARTGELLTSALSAAVRNVLLYRSLVDTIEEVAQARRSARTGGA